VVLVHTDTEHTATTKHRGLRYIFTAKHHGSDASGSCWTPALSLAEEFALFDRADGVQDANGVYLGVADRDGNLYGYERLLGPGLHLRELGIWGQQLAEYPTQKAGMPWHGYPIWPITPPPHLTQYGGHRCRPNKEVFVRMEELGHIDAAQKKRLSKGDFI
jgi:hypothetical protein